ncbi:MAG TPA: hypothetical protein VFE53_22990 [Mucilaginibacter sp.]|jgi:Leucine-rich repeat (LRR) protein|nr:hypothetical protein [Mucilaginibacter sp.]
MIRREYYHGPKVIDDLNNFDPSCTSISIFGNAKNIERLKDLNIDQLWVIGARDKDLQKILQYIQPKFISIYQVLAQDLDILETLSNTETIVLRWNTKSERLWNMGHNNELRALTIEDFPKINSVEPIEKALNLEYLVLEGGMWKPLKIETLKPLSKLKKLQFLRLANLHVKEDGLKPVAELTNLKELMLSNQFETSDYAYLSVKLPHTKCDSFQPFIKYDKPIGNNDTVITGKRKPFLNYENDRAKIEKYSKDFYSMVKKFGLE